MTTVRSAGTLAAAHLRSGVGLTWHEAGRNDDKRVSADGVESGGASRLPSRSGVTMAHLDSDDYGYAENEPRW